MLGKGGGGIKKGTSGKAPTVESRQDPEKSSQKRRRDDRGCEYLDFSRSACGRLRDVFFFFWGPPLPHTTQLTRHALLKRETLFIWAWEGWAWGWWLTRRTLHVASCQELWACVPVRKGLVFFGVQMLREFSSFRCCCCNMPSDVARGMGGEVDGMEKSRREKEGRKTRVLLLLLESSGKVVSWGRRCGWCV